MKLQSVSDDAFRAYGTVLNGYAFAPLLKVLSEQEAPTDGTVYVPSCAAMEALPIFSALGDRAFGGMPIQLGYCNGTNDRLTCVEYHRDSEINLAADDAILLLGQRRDIQNGTFDAARTEAFLLPKGTAVELYATTLHYAPCGQEFHVAVVLPRGTNAALPPFDAACKEDTLLFARNKWLLAHRDAPEAQNGAVVGMVGDMPNVANLLS